MAGFSGDPKSSDGAKDAWPTEIATAVTIRPDGRIAESAVPSLADDIDRAAGAETSLNPSPSSRALLAGAALPSSVHASLEVLSGGKVGRVYELTLTRTVVGRGEKADIRIDDIKASRKHAYILYSGDEFRVHDGGSGNGTFLNGSRVVEYAIRGGDELLIGDTLLRFRADAG